MSKLSELIENYANSKRPAYPTVDYPTILVGNISGNSVRCESLDQTEMYLTNDMLKNVTDPLGSPLVSGKIFFSDCEVQLSNFGPFKYNKKLWGVSHLQKQSKTGSLKTSPDCYHQWTWWKLQQKDANGGWIGGTERGIYYRKPLSWRWDVAGTTIDGKLQHWIWTKGYLGGHWD